MRDDHFFARFGDRILWRGHLGHRDRRALLWSANVKRLRRRGDSRSLFSAYTGGGLSARALRQPRITRMLVMSSEVETSQDIFRVIVRDSSTPLGITERLVFFCPDPVHVKNLAADHGHLASRPENFGLRDFHDVL